MQRLENFLAGYPAQKIAVAFHDLTTGAEYLFAADESFHPASTFKVAVMMEACHQVEKEALSLDDPIPMINTFQSIADGSLFSCDARDDADTSLYGKIGQTESLRELVRLMIVRSSNLATNILIRLLGAENITDYLRELGIDSVTVRRGLEDNKAFAKGLNNSASARGLMQMMILIASGVAVSHAASQEMEAILLGQEFNEGLPASLPLGIRVAHKTGWNDRLYHDVGIVHPGNRGPYVLAVMTEGFSLEEQAHSAVAEISKLIFDGVNGDPG